jgi:arabinofuranan 3-O-arabinosyltransferase
MTPADQDRPAPRGQWQPFGSPPGAGIDLTATMPLARIGPASDAKGPQWGDLRDRWWFLIVFLVALTILCGTNTGRLFFDTKLGVDIDAREFLVRLWSLWNPLEWLGSLQDQYIGYAIPMAPFFLAGQLLHVPVWLIERLWLSLLLAVGFTGMVKLARALAIGSAPSRLIAGAVFALWPTFTILIGSTSASALPGLVAPWAVLPLVLAVQGRIRPGRAAALSGLAIAAMGGVNAVCTLAVLILPAGYILTNTRSRQRVTLSLKWAAAVVAATAWWAIPLLLQGRYSFNFLPYIEQSSTTTRTLSAAAVLRGSGTWTAYFSLAGTPWLPAGWTMVTAGPAILASALASAAGLAGLARRDMPQRRWLCVCTGLVAMIALAGYYGPLGGPWHAAVGSLLDGPLAPFRSLYKIEPVIAVALALGCAHAVDRLWRLSLPIGRVRLAAAAVATPAVALALAGLAWPQLTGQTLQAGSFTSVPQYWYQTAAYLAQHSPRQTALVVPADPHGQFTWGDTIDDPLEPLATSPWVERGLVPYGGAGSQDLLATAEQAMESGQQVPGLAAYLARAGIRYVVVRNDTATNDGSYTPPQVVNETLAQSGFRRVAAFGPPVAATAAYPNLTGTTPGLSLSYPSVEVFEATSPALRPASPVTALPVSQTALVNGGSDSLLPLEAQGLLGSQPAVIAGQQLAAIPALWAVTDGQRRADTDYGAASDAQSYTYTAAGTNPVDDPLGDAGGPPRQLLPVTAAGHQTVAVLAGAASVTASSASTWFGESPADSPANAFDGNPATSWTEGNPYTPAGQWIQINFGHQVTLPSSVGIRLLGGTPGRAIASVLRVTTQAGSATTDTAASGVTQQLQVPAGPASWLRITILSARNVRPGGGGAGITDVFVPGVRVTTYLRSAEDVAAGSQAPAIAYSFTQQPGTAAAGQQLDRLFVTPAAEPFTARLTAVPVAGQGLTALLAKLTPAGRASFRVTASSSWDSLPEFGPGSMYEPTARLPWISRAGDPHPQLVFSWHGRRTISKLVLGGAYDEASTPTGVLIGAEHAYRLEKVGPGGVVRISPPVRTDKLYLNFPAASSAAAGHARLPVGLAGVTIPALAGLRPALPDSGARFHLACGQGPEVSVSQRSYRTSVTGTIGALIRLQPVQLHLCARGGRITLAAGQQRLSTGTSTDFSVTGLSLTSAPDLTGAPDLTSTPDLAGTAGGPPSRKLTILTWGADNRSIRIGPGSAAYVEVHENADPGWTATLDGHSLRPATLDGWQQAFIVPAGQGGTITLRFQPAAIYHAGLILSALLLLLLVALALGTARLRIWPARRVRRVAPPAAVVRTIRQLASAPARLMASSTLASNAVRVVPLAIVIAVAGGPIALAVPVLAVIAGRRPRWLPYIAAGAMVATGLLAAAAANNTTLGSGTFGGPAQACALIALAAALMPIISSDQT